MNEYPRYIPDEPMGVDLFEGGSQRMLSKVIAEHIIENDNEEDNGRDSRKKEYKMPRIIGIEGSWGSGKSNVIKLVENELKSSGKGEENGNDKYHFFEYDAWGNQEDLQRRSFLEQLTDYLIVEIFSEETKTEKQEYGKVKREWKNRLKQLLSYRREKTHESFPILTGGVFAIALTPLCTHIVSIYGESFSMWERWFIPSLPLICVLVVWIILLCIYSKRFGFGNYVVSLFTGMVQSEYDIETIYDKEPSVLEFRAWMKEVSNDLKRKGCGKLVVVFDNMDRLTPEKVKVLWSSIYTFFSGNDYDNIWVIIPYDRGQLSQAFIEREAQDDNENVNRLTQYFIDKTFPITYSVSTPVISDYIGIFTSLFRMAFGDLEKEAEPIINRLYRLKNSTPNIRSIIIFINGLVTLYKTNKRDISIVNMAIYQLNKFELEKDPINQILSGRYLEQATRVVDDNEELKAQIAALIYGVDKSLSFQIPLKGYITKCIDKERGYDINRYSQTVKKFHDVLCDVCYETDLAKLSDIIETLEALKNPNDNISAIWEYLATKQLHEPLNEATLPISYQLLLKHCSVDTQNKLVAYWQTLISGLKMDGSFYVDCLRRIRELCGDAVESSIGQLTVSPEFFLDALGRAGDDYKDYGLTASPTEVDKYLGAYIRGESKCYSLISILMNDNFCEFIEVKCAIEDMIDNDKKVNEGNVGEIVNIYRLISDDDKVLEKKLSQQRTSTLLSSLKNKGKTGEMDGYIDLLAMSIENSPTFEITEDQIPSLANIFEYYINADDLLLVGVKRNNSSLSTFIRYVIVNRIGKRVELKKVLPEHCRIKNMYKVTDEELIEYLNVWELNLDSDKMNINQLKSLIPETSMYKATLALSTKNELAAAINQLALEVFSKSVKDKDLKSINNHSINYSFNLINDLIINMDEITPPLNLVEYSKFLFKEYSKNTTNLIFDNYTRNIMAWIDRNAIADVFPEIRDFFCNGKGVITVEKFKFLEKDLRKYGALPFRSTEVINKILKPVITDKECKAIIIANSRFYKRIIKKGENIDDFISTVSRLWSKEECLEIGIVKP